MKPLLIAHRCGPDIYSEQSIASARHALSQGADMVEMDVRYTRDGAPVICHDPNTARVFGVDRCCCDMTLREFMALRYAVDGNCSAHSLEDVLRTDIRPLLLHCKISGELLKDLVGRVLAFDAGEACVFGVQRVDDVEIIKSIRPDLKVLAFMPRKQDLGRFLESRAEIIRLWEGWVTRERIQAIHRAGKRLWVMSGQPTEGRVGYTTEASLRGWVRLGVDGILVNDVRWTREILRA